jgi:hypothetical protein
MFWSWYHASLGSIRLECESNICQGKPTKTEVDPGVREIVDGDEVSLVRHRRRRRKLQVVCVTSLVKNHVLPRLSKHFSYHHCLIGIAPYRDLGPGTGGDHVVSADVDNTNAEVVGVSDLFRLATCSCSRYAMHKLCRQNDTYCT